MAAAATLTLADLLGELHQPDEHTSINHTTGGVFHSRVLPSHDLTTYLNTLPTTADVWYGVNTVAEGVKGRGKAEDVTRLTALYADLDVKPGGMPTFDAARNVVATLSEMLETEPAWLVATGHGLQPVWPLDHTDPTLHLDTEEKRAGACALLRRFGRLVTTVAKSFEGAVDHVFDLSRILRAPGTFNNKNPDQPVPVVAVARGGHQLDAAAIDDVLLGYGVPEQPEDRELLDHIVSPPADWDWAEHSCIYAQKMITGWAADNPDARHPWLLAQTTRLAAAVRYGCLTSADHTRAAAELTSRFHTLLAREPARKPNRGEIEDALTWGRQHVATLTPERLARELGSHPHQFEDLHHTADTQPPRRLSAVHTDGATALAARPEADEVDDEPNHPTAGATVHELGRRAAPNEDNTALVLVDRHAAEIRYVPQRGQWLRWDGHRWAWDETGSVHELVRNIARHLPGGEGWATYKKRALSLAGVRAVAGLAATDPRTVVLLSQLDAHPFALNTPAGIVDLTTGEITPPDPDQLHTRATSVAPDTAQPTPRWEQFLTETFAGHDDVLPYVQRLAGYSATGSVTHHVLPFLHGPGGNGKSVFLDVLRILLSDYAATSPAKFLMAGTQQHETEIARLAGLRLVIASEVNQDDKFDEAKVKLLTGGDALTARFMRQDHFTFTPTHHLWLMGNHQPRVTAGGNSFFRRLRLVPFDNTVPDEKKVDDLATRLVGEEGPGILAWIIRGAIDATSNGMGTPDSVLAATATYASEEDTLARFVSDLCEITSHDERVDTATLRVAYTRWCDTEGEKPMTPQVFGRELRSRYGIEQKRSNGRRYYTGLSLVDSSDRSDDDVESGEELAWWQK